MRNRLDQERETKLQPQRIEFAKNELTKLGLNILVCEAKVKWITDWETRKSNGGHRKP